LQGIVIKQIVSSQTLRSLVIPSCFAADRIVIFTHFAILLEKSQFNSKSLFGKTAALALFLFQ